MTTRTFWKADILSDNSNGGPVDQNRLQVDNPVEADLIASLTTNGLHMPCIDLDVPCRLVPSSTEGHFHLFIDVPISWRKYKRVLKSLWRAGIIERGFYKMSVARGSSYVRPEWAKKEGVS